MNNFQAFQNDNEFSEEDLESLARIVYDRLQQQWDIRAERQYGKMTDAPPWSSVIEKTNSAPIATSISSGKQNNESLRVDAELSVSGLENQLDLLSEEISILLRIKLQQERERLGPFNNARSNRIFI